MDSWVNSHPVTSTTHWTVFFESRCRLLLGCGWTFLSCDVLTVFIYMVIVIAVMLYHLGYYHILPHEFCCGTHLHEGSTLRPGGWTEANSTQEIDEWYPLVISHSHGKPWPIEIDDFPNHKPLFGSWIFHGYVSHKQMITVLLKEYHGQDITGQEDDSFFFFFQKMAHDNSMAYKTY